MCRVEATFAKYEYKNLLKRAHRINKLSKQKTERAKVFLFIYNVFYTTNK